MVRFELWEKRYNEKYDYTEVNLKLRRSLKEKEVIDFITLNEFLTDDNNVRNFNDKQYNIHNEKYVLEVYCASYNQFKRFYDFMKNVNGGEELKRVYI